MNTDLIGQCEVASKAAFAETPSGRRDADIAIYLAHVEAGLPMRAIAAARGAHPSTVLRAVRRVESQRDDPLMDRALDDLGRRIAASGRPGANQKESGVRDKAKSSAMTKADKAIMRRLCEPEAFLMVGQGAGKAGVFCRKNRFRRPLAMVDLDKAGEMLRRDWIRCVAKTQLSAKYEATAVGRAALRRVLAAEAPAEATGFAEASTPFAGQHQAVGERRIANVRTGEIETIRVNLGESPLGWLARRRDANGEPLLAPEEVEAGERLREDFELAQIGPKLAQDWRRFLTPADRPTGGGRTPSEGPLFARERVAKALAALGPGLSDAALRVCCFLEGLEATERRMGWSARSGKVVLKLALQRLVDHYGLVNKADRAA